MDPLPLRLHNDKGIAPFMNNGQCTAYVYGGITALIFKSTLWFNFHPHPLGPPYYMVFSLRATNLDLLRALHIPQAIPGLEWIPAEKPIHFLDLNAWLRKGEQVHQLVLKRPKVQLHASSNGPIYLKFFKTKLSSCISINFNSQVCCVPFYFIGRIPLG